MAARKRDAFQQGEMTLYRIIRNARRFVNHPTTKPERKLLKRGLMPYSVLDRIVKPQVSTEAVTIAMDSLIDAGVISTGEENGFEVYWPTT